MARTDIFDTDVDFDTDIETITETNQEDNVTENTADDKAAKVAAADAEHLPAVEAFKQVVTEAVEAADPSTGTVDAVALEKVAEAYRNVTGGIKYKNLAKDFVDESMKAALPAGEYIKAVSFNEVSEKLRTTKAAPKASAPKVDPKVAFGERVAILELATELLTNRVPEEAEGYEVPSTEAAFNQANEWLDWKEADEETRGDEPELTGIAQAAVKVFQGKGVGARRSSGGTRAPFTGVRRNVGNHIASAFEGVAPGTFLTVSEIVKHRSEEYGDDAPSSGAVSARLFPQGDASRCNIPGITPGVNAAGVKGATKN
ncbi:hypothetical protein SEA_HARAMBE_88 [Gordonia phage Harambe]|uniref:Uncharacterized protein n=7 Tax=Woesvirus woes TaxID=1982751 RepID=A0A482JDX9_9CAUD|nr:hypothetical protein SEA_ANAMIKA_88 [Gordonia phage Anamika]QAX94371.1 hypothetical protein SEA_GUILLAUME_88 [Gordonia phage Guillaume]QAX94694.1 hypothetical protein SEA_HARAMBE_88 [Gordonia phage Harambe]QBP30365.1 hypothetical protein SEA_JORMUNGANDR_88 [Gordonia phage Jormungandr]QBP30661.1 hypothetical protein SEA_LAHIRIUM_89 [Gordonia phage Lahirium]QBP31863.1 hypothetical protein SEA_NIMI13_88 [Gordonia phage Nimi13]QDF16947.1 hypothetical protein SEA_TEAL_88 [Gordonia phage Teal]